MWYYLLMIIHNPNNLPTVDYRRVKPLQNNLKDLHTENHDKLLHVLETRGFTAPLIIWIEPETGTKYLLDGHQRQRVMELNELSDNGNFEVPYVEVKAANKKVAVEMLLEITSQFGTITQDGLDELVADLDIDLEDMDINFDQLKWLGSAEPLEPEEEPEKEPASKSSSYTIEALRAALGRFERQTDSNAADEFIDWLETE